MFKADLQVTKTWRSQCLKQTLHGISCKFPLHPSFSSSLSLVSYRVGSFSIFFLSAFLDRACSLAHHSDGRHTTHATFSSCPTLLFRSFPIAELMPGLFFFLCSGFPLLGLAGLQQGQEELWRPRALCGLGGRPPGIPLRGVHVRHHVLPSAAGRA